MGSQILNIPNKETKVANRFLGSKVSKKVKFMGQEIEIVKLSISQVTKIQERVKALEGGESAEGENLRLLALVVQEGAPELRDLSQEDINSFAMDELTGLSNEVMKYSGLGKEQAK